MLRGGRYGHCHGSNHRVHARRLVAQIVMNSSSSSEFVVVRSNRYVGMIHIGMTRGFFLLFFVLIFLRPQGVVQRFLRNVFVIVQRMIVVGRGVMKG